MQILLVFQYAIVTRTLSSGGAFAYHWSKNKYESRKIQAQIINGAFSPANVVDLLIRVAGRLRYYQIQITFRIDVLKRLVNAKGYYIIFKRIAGLTIYSDKLDRIKWGIDYLRRNSIRIQKQIGQ